jgi:DNA-binding transcriptional LysR family regulator
MDRFLMIEAFVRVADTGSFAEAARHLGVANSVVSARVHALEAYINAPLFHRSTRHVRLSETGEAYYRECAEMVLGFVNLSDQMRGVRTSPAGRLRIQMLPGFALDHFGPMLQEFGSSYRDMRIEIVVNDRVVDPIEEGVDVTFQIFPPLSESLVARRMFEVRRLFCASPEYVKSHGTPAEPADLLRHRTGVYLGYPTRNRWVFHLDGAEMEIELPGHVRSNSVHLLRDFARRAGGIVCLPTLVASKELVEGHLVPVLQQYRLSSFSFAAVFARTQRDTVKVRLLVDFIASKFKDREEVPPWDAPLVERGWLRLDR